MAGTSRGPCVAGLCADPNVASQWKYIDESDHSKGSVCKLGKCRWFLRMQGPPKTAGRPRGKKQRPDDDESDYQGEAGSYSPTRRRVVPKVISGLLEIKGIRCIPPPCPRVSHISRAPSPTRLVSSLQALQYECGATLNFRGSAGGTLHIPPTARVPLACIRYLLSASPHSP